MLRDKNVFLGLDIIYGISRRQSLTFNSFFRRTAFCRQIFCFVVISCLFSALIINISFYYITFILPTIKSIFQYILYYYHSTPIYDRRKGLCYPRTNKVFFSVYVIFSSLNPFSVRIFEMFAFLSERSVFSLHYVVNFIDKSEKKKVLFRCFRYIIHTNMVTGSGIPIIFNLDS